MIQSGGVATLNNRLITVVPPGRNSVVDSCRRWLALSLADAIVSRRRPDAFAHPDRQNTGEEVIAIVLPYGILIRGSVFISFLTLLTW